MPEDTQEPPHDQYEPGLPKPWIVAVVCLLIAYLATGFYAVKSGEHAVVRRCGRALIWPRGPGLHFGLPYGLDRVSRVRMSEHKRVAIGTTLSERALGRRPDPLQSECLTGDRNLIHLTAIVQYQVARPREYLFNVADIDLLVQGHAMSALSSAIADMHVDDVWTVKRISIQNEVRRTTQEALDRCWSGVKIASVSLESAAPPPEVAAAFQDVTAARGDASRVVYEATEYADQLKRRASAEADRLAIEAQGYHGEVIEKAHGDAERFLEAASKLSENRSLTARRLILETMEEVLPRMKKVIMDGNARQALNLGLFEGKE